MAETKAKQQLNALLTQINKLVARFGVLHPWSEIK